MDNYKNNLKKIWNIINYKFMKFIPLIGLIILFVLYFGKTGSDISQNSNLSTKEKLIETFNAFKDSFYWGDNLYTFTTIVLLTTLWTGYKYWLVKIKFISYKRDLLEKIIIAGIVLIFLMRHINTGSMIGKYLDWVLFLMLLYFTIILWWFILKTLDRINLGSDLYCWGLRIIGTICIIFGFILFFSSSFALTLSNSKLVLNNIYWIISLLIIILGFFMEYRSMRRHPAIHVW